MAYVGSAWLHLRSGIPSGRGGLRAAHEPGGHAGEPSRDRGSCRQLHGEAGEGPEVLGLQGEGEPCNQSGISCSNGCVEEVDASDARGDLRALSHLHSLRTLKLGEGVSGMLGDLTHLTSLEHLKLKGRISGDLSVLAKMPNLTVIELQETRITGKLQALRQLRRLRELVLTKTMVGGELGDLQNVTDLEELRLSDTQVSGKLSAVGSLSKLVYLRLESTWVTGFLEAVQGLTGLRGLFLDRTQVSGNLSALGTLTQLRGLSLDETRVQGDLAALEGLDLIQLRLPRTQVSGHLNALSLRWLHILDLAETEVSGELRDLARLQRLRQLFLQGTDISGQLSDLERFRHLRKVSVANTRVRGSFPSDLRGRCEGLTWLDLADSRVGGLSALAEGATNLSTKPGLLPDLEHLNVSGCALNTTAAELLVPLAAAPLETLAAAGSGLHGPLPNLTATKMGKSLRHLEMQGNEVSHLPTLEGLEMLDLSNNRVPLALEPGVLTVFVQNGTKANFENTSLVNGEDIRKEFQRLKGKLLHESQHLAESYACKTFASTLRATPELFLPEETCQCRPGHAGRGVNCQACPANTFAENDSQPECEPCPANSTSANGSASLSACECAFGNARGGFRNRSCQCGVREAELQHQCISCNKLHLVCNQEGTIARHAAAEENHARIKDSLQVFRCLDSGRCRGGMDSACEAGYSGPLCVQCAPGYRSSGRICDKCRSLRQQSLALVGAASMGTLAFVGACIGAAWLLRSYAPKPGLGVACAAQLLVSQAAGLLQLAQLWVLLARLVNVKQAKKVLQEALATNVTDTDTSAAGGSTMESDPLVSYMEVLQLTGTELSSFLDLQCHFDGASVRAAFAVATPVLPLLVLAACATLELWGRGKGIQLALRALTLLFVGGASGAVQLLGCQREDGEGAWIGDDWAFRPLFPWLKCSKDTAAAALVDGVGWTTGAIYGVVVPCFLAFLLFKQRRVMRQCKTFVVVSAEDESGGARLKLTPCSTSQHFEEGLLARRLLAAAAAHLATQRPGRALVELRPDAVIVTSEDHAGVGCAGDKYEEFSAESFIAETNKLEESVLRRNYIMQMLTERSILEEIQSDRLLLGARQLLCKYAYCDGVWMEVALKLASACLVPVVSARDGLWLSMAITFGMAVIIGSARPFAQPQVNTLQSFSFCCLTVSAIGFAYRCIFLTRLALLAPALLAAAQLLRPDSRESLAQRLQQELGKQIEALRRGEAVAVCAEEVRLL
ncbi:GSO2 [Symbiodinium natans]|uniref:GSO2 protein n=1 Tax=Symbiodinium natans TaxID=878477 RepID=A0A812U055_9DINO|nr:GSO2 [Symbiodinium natans]